MNNEIREILDKLKDDGWYEELDLTGDKWIELKQTETNKILDYITNLQNENQKLKEIIERNLQNFYINSEMHKQTKEKLNDYKSRVEKAVEYVDRETGKGIYESGYGRGTAITICKEHLLNILQNGSEK